ncbi:sialidase family protein [Poriferisphaera sp. WC338]|uniref:sialidase family protein n=1 Tax=Poriferisphaera sp. WC338 TaxID=3425129 RepID=UPI003D812D2F
MNVRCIVLILNCLLWCGITSQCFADTTAYRFGPDDVLPDTQISNAPPSGWNFSFPDPSAQSSVQRQDGAIHFLDWPLGSRLQSPHGLIPTYAIEPGGSLTVVLKLRIDAGRLYLRLHNGVRFFEVAFTPTHIGFSKINPNEGETFSSVLSDGPHIVKIQFRGRQVAIIVDGKPVGRFDAGLGGGSAFSGLELLANDPQQLPEAWLYKIIIQAKVADARATPRQPAEPLAVRSAWPTREFSLDKAHVAVGSLRVLMRQARSALVVADDDLILLTGTHTIASEDQGDTWRPRDTKIDQLNSVFLADGRLLLMRFDPTPVPDQPGLYQTERWMSNDRGKTIEAIEPALLHLPTDIFDPARLQWFHSGLVRTPNGDLLSIMQGEELVDDADVVMNWRLYLVRSQDEGRTWKFVSILADQKSLDPISEDLTATGWRIYGGVEPSLVALDEQTLICVARTVDDESYLDEALFAEGRATYHDLSYTVKGDEIHPSIAQLPPDLYFEPGVPSASVILMRSENGGKTWSKPQQMKDARGCFPRLAYRDGVIALTFGGLAVPRWGGGIIFSFDRGHTWTEPVIFAPLLSTGYTAVVPTGTNRFTVFFDSTPPQSWVNPGAYWIGATDITIHRRKPK